MSNNFNEEIKRLEKFNEIVEALEGYSLSDIKILGVAISSPDISEVKIESIGPTEESTSAFIAKFRFFLMDKDEVSFRNLGRIYERLPIPANLKIEYDELRNKINQYLDSKTGIDEKYARQPTEAIATVTQEELKSLRISRLINQPNETQNTSFLSRRDIMETIVWGLYCHTEFEEQNKLKGTGNRLDFMQSSIAWNFIKMEFEKTIMTVTDFAIAIKYLNEEVIQQLKGIE